MNKYEHAASSAELFGGTMEDFLPYHAIIDSNKLVTPSIFGRFFLHHIDIGLPILQKVFLKTMKGGDKNLIEKIFLQHLFEDYGRILTFESYWLPALKSVQNKLPQIEPWDNFILKAKKDPRLENESESLLAELEQRFRAKEFVKRSLLDFQHSNLEFCIFGHALGADLLAQIIGPKFEGRSTLDLLTGFLNCRFINNDKTKDGVPTLLDWEKHIPDHAWMHAPTGP
jgi:hypothetical protein